MSTIARFVLAVSLVALFGCGRTVGINIEGVRPVPDVYRASFETSRGSFVIEVTKSWAPEGAERFYRLLQQRFYDDARFFRVVRNFVVQFGINGNPAVEARWRDMTFADDPVKESNLRGTISFATSGPNTRTTQVFINLKDNAQLDKRGFAPFGKVVEGLDVVDRLYNGYGDSPPRGEGPDQNLIETQGNAYLESKFQMLDYIRKARLVGGTAP
jgi:peptidyl-prolyl cis-trans isomerase A (cyclophilin A)